MSGTLALGNGENGIYVDNVDNFTIGGSTNAAANLISANGGDGIYDYDGGTSGLIENNMIGGGRSITLALPNAQSAVELETIAYAGTLTDVSKSEWMPAAAEALSQATRTAPAFASAEALAQQSPRRLVLKMTNDAMIYVGKGVPGGVKVVMRGGSITARQLGVSLAAGIIISSPVGSATPQFTPELISPLANTAAPPIDLEGGANPLTSEPVLNTATTAAGTTVTGTLDSQPSASYLIQFYSVSQVPSPDGPGEEYQYIGSAPVTTNAAGNGAFAFTAPTTVPVGGSIAATATLLDSSGNLIETSEFSAGILVQNQQPQPQPQVATVTTTNLVKRHKNEGVSTITIVFNEAMAPLADSAGFYSLVTPKKVRVHKKTRIEMVPVHFTARLTAANAVTLKLTKPSKQPLTVTVKTGDPAADGETLANNFTLSVR